LTTFIDDKNDQSEATAATSFLARILATPTEDFIYRSYFTKELWSVDDFAALVAGLTPEKFREIGKQEGKHSKKEITRSLFAFKVIEKFYKSLKDILELSVLSDNKWYMSPWKFMKWLA
jgi:hypothetical protein